MFRKRDYNQALDVSTQSINFLESAHAYINRATIYMKLWKYQEAENDFAKALELDGEYVEAYKRRALTRKQYGCIKDMETAITMKPDDEKLKQIYIYWIRYFNAGLYDENSL